MFYRHLMRQASTPLGEFLAQAKRARWGINKDGRKEGD
jgi:hypothetical protein